MAEKPLLYISCTSKTDPAVAPAGLENLVVLIPVAPGLHDSQDVREKYFEYILRKLAEVAGRISVIMLYFAGTTPATFCCGLQCL
jgi:phytoene desaturase